MLESNWKITTPTADSREVKHVPSSDANVFPEYILPSIVPLCHDKNEMVRSALARHIAEVQCRTDNLTLSNCQISRRDAI